MPLQRIGQGPGNHKTGQSVGVMRTASARLFIDGKKKNSFSRSGNFVWNSLPLKIRHVNKRTFKKELRVSLLNILESENEYIGVSELITRLPKVKFTV